MTTTPPSSPSTLGFAGRGWRLPPVRGMVTLLAGESASRALSFLAIALLTRRLGAPVWAPIAVALTFTQFGTLLVEMGMRLLGAREVARDAAHADKLVSPVLATQLAVALAIVAVTVLASSTPVVDRDLAVLLPGYAVSLVALPFFLPWVFQGLGVMEWVAIPQVARFAFFLVVSALLVRGPERAAWLPWLEASAVTTGALVAVWAIRRFRVRIAVSPRSAFQTDVMRESLPIAASQLVWVVRMYLPTLVLWYVASRVSVARFDVAHRVLMVLQGALTMYMANLLTPLSRAAHDGRRGFLGLLVGSGVFSTVGTVLVALLISARPGPLLGLLNGQEFNTAEGARNLVLLAFVAPVLNLRGHAHYALIALGRQRLELACSVASAVLLAVLLGMWVPSGGSSSAAWALLTSEVAGTVLTWAALLYQWRGARSEGRGAMSAS